MEASMTWVFSGSPVLAGFRKSLGASQKKKKKKSFTLWSDICVMDILYTHSQDFVDSQIIQTPSW